MDQETKSRMTYGLMGFALGVVLTMMIAFKGGFLITKGEAENMGNRAVLAMRATICAAQFNNDPHVQDKRKEFKALNFVDRDNYIAKGGWDKMPGEEKASEGVNRACGDKLAADLEK